jgi:hypothetical protein
MDKAWGTCEMLINPTRVDNIENWDFEEYLKNTKIPCSGKINNKYVISVIARSYGFKVLETFFLYLSKEVLFSSNSEVYPAFDTLRDFAVACHRKHTQRALMPSICEFCEAPTELSAGVPSFAKKPKNPSGQLHLSALFCTFHRPSVSKISESPSSPVRSHYRKERRNKPEFDIELYRLDRHARGWSSDMRPSEMCRSKGCEEIKEELVNEYISRLVAYKMNAMQDYKERINFQEIGIRLVARDLLYRKITDIKKIIMMLLASGLNQTAIAKKLKLGKQAVSKALLSVPAEYRFDLIPYVRLSHSVIDLEQLIDRSSYRWPRR